MEHMINSSFVDSEEECSLEGVTEALEWLTGQVCACADYPLIPTLMQLLPPLLIVFCASALPLDCGSVVLSVGEARQLQPLVAASLQRILIITADLNLKLDGLNGRRAVIACNSSHAAYVKTEFEASFRQVPMSNLSLLTTLLQNLPSDVIDPRREVILCSFNCTVFSEMSPLSEDGHPSWHSGLELKAVTSLLEWKGLRWRIVLPEDKFGEVYTNGSMSAGGIKWYLSEALADIALCSIWVTANLNLTIRPTPSVWQRLSSRLLVPRPQAMVPHWLAFLSALPLSFWLVHLVSFAFTSVILHLYHFRRGEETWDGFGSSFYQAFTLCFQGVLNKQPARWSLQIMQLSWGVLILLASNSFSSFLVARLTTPLLPEPIDTIEKLVLAGYKWVSGFNYVPPDNAGAYFDLRTELEWKWFHTQVSHEQVAEGRTALWVQELDENRFYIGKPQGFSRSFLSTLMPSKQFLSYQLIGIITRRLSSYSEWLSTELIHLYESGIYSKIHSDVLRSRYMKRFFVVTSSSSGLQLSGGTPLSLVSLRGAFYVLLGGLTLSAGVFLLEIIYHRDIKLD